jgi:hypothetical protein
LPIQAISLALISSLNPFDGGAVPVVPGFTAESPRCGVSGRRCDLHPYGGHRAARLRATCWSISDLTCNHSATTVRPILEGMQVEPFYATRIVVGSKIFHNQSECGPGKQVMTRGHGVKGDVSDKTICARCAAIAEAAVGKQAKTKKEKKKKKKKKGHRATSVLA